MTQRITGFAFWFHYDAKAAARELVVDYTPVAGDETVQVKTYNAQLRVTPSHVMQAQLDRLADYVRELLPAPEIEVQGVALRGSPVLWYYQVKAGPKPRLTAAYYASPDTRNPTETGWIEAEQLPPAAMRLIESLIPTCEQLAWEDLRKRLGHPEPGADHRKKVLISYRKGSIERQRFVEAIAHRLGREHFVPWYDEWEIKAGDSIARGVATGLENVYAMILVLTPDYPGERWAREEFESAITKRTEHGIRVIPVIYEPCQRPELLRTLRYVDCTSHEEAQIERQFLNLIDALNEIELNPYR